MEPCSQFMLQCMSLLFCTQSCAVAEATLQASKDDLSNDEKSFERNAEEFRRGLCLSLPSRPLPPSLSLSISLPLSLSSTAVPPCIVTNAG